MIPSEMHFTAIEVRGKGCRSCIFEHERVSVCRAVEQMARLAGLPNCEYPTRPGHSVIYVVPETDPRQQSLL